MLIINLIVIALAILAIWFGIKKYLGRNKPIEEQVMFNRFASPAVPTISRSKFFPDQLYVGKISKLDTSIRYLLTNLLFAFPTDPLIVKEFKLFDIDGNEFEEVVFDKLGVKNYIMLIDHVEQNIYFLNRVMSTTINSGDIPPMACQDVIELEEGGTTFEYTDMSGLIEVQVSQFGSHKNNRLIRVYEREVTPEDQEFLICIQDKPGVVDYYLGFNITINQLEDI
jgi:hypothetical protein